MYTENDLVRVAKRENNNKRKYLVVNRLQGKHVPVSPKEMFCLCKEMADVVRNAYPNEKLLLVGFAETATAIGAALAVELDTYYMQTTREVIEGVEYLFFTESHSHATEQKLVKNDLDEKVDEIQRIVFVEDEVTTGNTILNIIDIIEKKYPQKIAFSVASLLNGMDEESLKRYEERSINVHYLVKTNHDMYTEIAESFRGDGENVSKELSVPAVMARELYAGAYMNARRCVQGDAYQNACEQLWKQVESKFVLEMESDKNILVLGTEEFMYPALYVAGKLEESGKAVRCHSTTRSPITVSTEENYPLHKRFELASLYEDERKTFIYDLGQYDKVFIITDSVHEGKEGLYSLLNALALCGNQDISLVRWC